MLGLWHSSFLSPSFLQVSGWGHLTDSHRFWGTRQKCLVEGCFSHRCFPGKSYLGYCACERLEDDLAF